MIREMKSELTIKTEALVARLALEAGVEPEAMQDALLAAGLCELTGQGFAKAGVTED